MRVVRVAGAVSRPARWPPAQASRRIADSDSAAPGRRLSPSRPSLSAGRAVRARMGRHAGGRTPAAVTARGGGVLTLHAVVTGMVQVKSSDSELRLVMSAREILVYSLRQVRFLAWPPETDAAF